MKTMKIDKSSKSRLKKYVSLNVDEEKEFPLPKYTTQILNLISSNAQATRPKYVGQMSEIVPAFIKEYHKENNKFPDWKDWEDYYLENYKDEYEAGKKRLKEYLEIHKEALDLLINDDGSILENWYNKFIMIQNFKGFQYEEFIFHYIKREIFKEKKYSVRKATPDEESKGIDIVVSKKDDYLFLNIKPLDSFERIEKRMNLNHNYEVILIFYSIKEDDLEIRFLNDDDYDKIENF